jgi:hypothetical protein
LRCNELVIMAIFHRSLWAITWFERWEGISRVKTSIMLRDLFGTWLTNQKCKAVHRGFQYPELFQSDMMPPIMYEWKYETFRCKLQYNNNCQYSHSRVTYHEYHP